MTIKEKLQEYKKEYYETNKITILEKNKIKIKCECGCEFVKKRFKTASKQQKTYQFNEVYLKI
jgi:redox-regulated HSP33 family molecular chaperone